ncbi:unnamed protein product, partial [Closterium sp. NIES-53]
QSGGQEIGEQQTGEQQIGEERIEEQQMVDEQLGEQQTGEPQTGEQEMWGIRDGGRVLASGTITAPLSRSTRTGGYIFVLGGAAVSWASQRIRCATLSSTESEYVAAVEAGKEARRLRFLLAEFQLLRSEEPTTLFVDNSSAISVAGGMGLKGSLKHMERRHMWLQHMVKRRKLQLQYIPTSEQPADYLTKALHFPAFSHCFEAVGQVRLSSEGSET